MLEYLQPDSNFMDELDESGYLDEVTAAHWPDRGPYDHIDLMINGGRYLITKENARVSLILSLPVVCVKQLTDCYCIALCKDLSQWMVPADPRVPPSKLQELGKMADYWHTGPR